ncbi:MAG: hypothetical protein OXR62_02830 [Ahrensia sp.]|nr:hypothetical protein [Ahrensia sp.]
MKIAIIGNGNVGSGLAKSLSPTSYDVTAYGRDADLRAVVGDADYAALVLRVTSAVSIPLIAILLGSVWDRSGFGWTFSNECGGWEFPLFWAIVQGVILLLGAGAHALRPPVIERTLGRFA